MNASRMMINLARRSYATRIRKPGKRQLPNPGVQNRLDVLEEERKNDFELFEDPHLVDEEPDFSRVDQSYTAHKKELARAKESLKLRIVARKYFKSNEPSLLTYMEKEQIRYLHSTDPSEYTPEKLSESFPSLPQTIRKVIKAKWKPKTGERVLKHDQNVIENWKKFKRGELPLEPRLREHLERFKDRKISLPNREEVEQKFVAPEPKFVKPKSQMYSGIIQSYFQRREDPSVISVTENILSLSKKQEDDFLNDKNNETSDQKYLAEVNNSREKFTATSEAATNNQPAVMKQKKFPDRMLGSKNVVTVDEFFKHAVKNIGDTPSLEEKVLIDTYKRKIDSDTAKAEESLDMVDRSSSRKFDPCFKGGDSVTLLKENDLQAEVEEQKNFEIIESNPINVSKEFGLETYVKAWEKKASEEEYPETIKIPKNKYQKGKIYQLRDCYYDDDGEFLFRVPGIKT